MRLVDTSVLLAGLDRRQRHHEQCLAVLSEDVQERILSPFVLAELDYLVSRRLGAPAAEHLALEVARGAFSLARFDGDDVGSALKVMRKYRDLEVGLADASIVVLAERHDIADVLTLDERHFRAMRFGRGRKFRLLPADA